ncbi:MAG: hypothetical protein ACP5JU_02030 [Minisyncoccia bacterium]
MERKERGLRFFDFKTAINFIYPDIKKIEELNDLLIIDIDGVLLKLDIKTFLRGLYLLLFNKKKFKEYLKDKKIPLSCLLKIKRLVNKGAKIILLTSRYLNKDRDYFPFISEKTKEKFKKAGIDIISLQKYKIELKIPEEILDAIKEKDRVFYLGSGIFDKRLFKRLKNEIKDKKMDYFDIGFAKII